MIAFFIFPKQIDKSAETQNVEKEEEKMQSSGSDPCQGSEIKSVSYIVVVLLNDCWSPPNFSVRCE